MEGARAVAVILAAGSGSRLGGDGPKALRTIGGRPLVAVAVERALASPSITGVVVAAPPGFETKVREALAPSAGSSVVVTGGATRQRSVAAGLDAVDAQADVVVVHDAARPFASAELFTTVVDAVVSGADAAVPVLPLVDTVKRVRANAIVGTEPRDELALAQTPQACRIELLRDGLAKAEESGFDFTDDAGLLEWAGASVRTVVGEPGNFKITTALDLARADEILGAGGVTDLRAGLGFDVHARDPSRELWLGGLRFGGESGLVGHSDGDVVCHAIADALLGAAALGDVGQHFPDTDPAVEGIGGLELLARAVALLADAGHAPGSCDVTLLCERPAIAPRRDEMRAALARVLDLPLGRVSVKATRPEGLGLSADGVGCLSLATLR